MINQFYVEIARANLLLRQSPNTDNFLLPCMSTAISQSHVFELSNPLPNPTLVSVGRKIGLQHTFPSEMSRIYDDPSGI
jgi:hypothetical protein